MLMVVGDEIGGGGCTAKARSTTQPMPFSIGIVVDEKMLNQNSGLAEQRVMKEWNLQNVKSESEKCLTQQQQNSPGCIAGRHSRRLQPLATTSPSSPESILVGGTVQGGLNR